MNLSKKKHLAIRALGIGKSRIVFVKTRLDEIKEAITKEDIKQLVKEKAIIIKEKKGRKKITKKARKKGAGKIRLKVNKRKKEYVIMTRKLRKYIKMLKENNKISNKEFKDIRKKIRNKKFPSLNNLKDYLEVLKE